MLYDDQNVEVKGATAPSNGAVAANGPLTIEVVTSAEGFDRLEAEWNTLLEQSDARIYQTYEWQRTWWKHYGEPRSNFRLLLILVRNGRELLGIAPFFIERVAVAWPVTYRLLAFIGRGPSDYLDLLACRGREREVTSAVVRYLAEHRRDFDVLLLEEIRDTSPSGSALAEALSNSGFAVERFVNEHCPRLHLAESFEATTARFSSSKRSRVLKARKTILESFHAEFEEITEPAALDEAFDDFITIHQARWNAVGHPGVFSDQYADRFHREVVRHLLNRHWLILAFLKIGGQRMAADYGLAFRGEFMTYLGGARGEDEFLRHSPGKAVLLEIMERIIPRGFTVFDFMRGNERYKYELGGKDVPNWTIMSFSRPGRVTPMLHRAGLLRTALARRSKLEWQHVAHHARKHGVFSTAFAGYLLSRTSTLASDAVQKARAPEKSVIMGKVDG